MIDEISKTFFIGMLSTSILIIFIAIVEFIRNQWITRKKEQAIPYKPITWKDIKSNIINFVAGVVVSLVLIGFLFLMGLVVRGGFGF